MFNLSMVTLTPPTHTPSPSSAVFVDEALVIASHYVQDPMCLWRLGHVHFVLILPLSFSHGICSVLLPHRSRQQRSVIRPAWSTGGGHRVHQNPISPSSFLRKLLQPPCFCAKRLWNPKMNFVIRFIENVCLLACCSCHGFMKSLLCMALSGFLRYF